MTRSRIHPEETRGVCRYVELFKVSLFINERTWWIQLEVERGAICRVGAKNIVTSKRAKGAQKILGLYSGKILWFFN